MASVQFDTSNKFTLVQNPANIPNALDSRYVSSSIDVIPPGHTSNPMQSTGPSTQRISNIVLDVADYTNTNLKEKMPVFMRTPSKAVGSDGYVNSVLSLTDMNLHLRKKHKQMMGMLTQRNYIKLNEVRHENERNIHGHSIFKGMRLNDLTREFEIYETQYGILDTWPFYGIYAMPGSATFGPSNIGTPKTNLNLTLTTSGTVFVHDLWGAGAMPGAHLFLILKRRKIAEGTYGEFQYYPHYIYGMEQGLPREEDLYYEDLAGYSQTGALIYVGKVLGTERNNRSKPEDIRVQTAQDTPPENVHPSALVRRLGVIKIYLQQYNKAFGSKVVLAI